LDKNPASNNVNKLVIFFLVFPISEIVFISLLKKIKKSVSLSEAYCTFIAVRQTTKESGSPEV